MTEHSKTSNWSRRTLAAQAMGTIDAPTGAIIPPIHVATTYLRDPDNQYRTGNIYGRPDNPNVREAEHIIAMLEGGEAGLVFGSGMSAATALFMALSPGDHIVAPEVMYWGLRHWLLTEAARWGLETSFVDMSDLAQLQRAMRPRKTKLVWAETPSNPLWSITDIAAVAKIAHKSGALLAVDSTSATPVLTRPLEHGADIVMHSATKYLNGHSDVVAGALVAAKADEIWAKVAINRRMFGQILAPLETYLLIRGIRTLHVRVQAACANAMALAQSFAAHPLVERVLYPGLASHPGHVIAARQMQGGFGGMLSIRVKGGEAAAISSAARVRLWKRATSLGGVESLIEHRASIEGPSSPCPPDLLRLSAGIEDSEDLFRDLDQALRGANT